MLVPFFVIMVLESARRKRQIREEEDEEEGYGGSEENPEEEEDYAEEEVGSGDLENIESPTKQDQSQTPLWKYVQRQEGGKGGGTTKFICPHCNKQYHGSYTRLRRHLCGIMPGDGTKNFGIKVCTYVPAPLREIYRKEEGATLQFR